MPAKTGWTAEADRHLLLAMAMASSGANKPCPKWDAVESIMKTKWGYGFSASALYQHFNKKIWKEVIDGVSDAPAYGNGASASPPACTGTTKKRPAHRQTAKRKNYKEEDDSDTSSVIETPSKKAKTSPVKKPRGRPSKPATVINVDEEDKEEDIVVPKEEVDEDDLDGMKRARSPTVAGDALEA